MIIPDINLLLYAYDSESPFHAKAAAWWQDCLSGSEPVGFPSTVVFGFIRIATNRRAFCNPLSVAEASENVRAWLAQPVARILEPGTGHIEEVMTLLETLGTAGNLVTDAQIAALAIEYDAIIHTADADFLRFPRLRWYNPLSGMGTKGLTAR